MKNMCFWTWQKGWNNENILNFMHVPDTPTQSNIMFVSKARTLMSGAYSGAAL